MIKTGKICKGVTPCATCGEPSTIIRWSAAYCDLCINELEGARFEDDAYEPKRHKKRDDHHKDF